MSCCPKDDTIKEDKTRRHLTLLTSWNTQRQGLYLKYKNGAGFRPKYKYDIKNYLGLYNKLTSRTKRFIQFNADRHPASNPVDKWGTLPHGQVRLGRGQPGIWTGRLPQLHKRRALLWYHTICRQRCQHCVFVQWLSCTDNLGITETCSQLQWALEI